MALTRGSRRLDIDAMRTRRQELGLTPTDLAQRTGLARRTIWNLESDPNRGISPETLHKIATVLSVEVDDISIALDAA